MGSAATLADRSSQPALVWIARQSSSQPETIDPGSSCARNLTGTAMRPLSSTVCRYSPVNTFGSTPDRSVGLGGRGFWEFPTSHHFVPLRCILGCESRYVKMESVLVGSGGIARASGAGRLASLTASMLAVPARSGWDRVKGRGGSESTLNSGET